MAQTTTPDFTARRTDTTSKTPAGLQQTAEDTVASVKAQGAEAKAAFSDVADSFGDALDDSLKSRPYATLAIVAGIGFLLGAVWKS